MDNDLVSTSANFIGIATGCGALLGCALYRAHLPKWRYQGLEDVLKRTEEMWTAESHLVRNNEARESIEDRLGMYVSSLRMRMQPLSMLQQPTSLRRDVHAIRERALGDITFVYQYKQFFKGLTVTMIRTITRIEGLRAEIIVSSREYQ